MAVLFRRLTGVRRVIPCYTAASGYADGTLVQTDESTGGNATYQLPTVAVAGSNAGVLGIVVGTTDAAGITFVDVLKPGDWVDAPTSSSMTYAYLGKECDITNGTTIAVQTDSSHDCRVVGWDGKSTSRTWVQFLMTETTKA
jgi:hypothetical protein